MNYLIIDLEMCMVPKHYRSKHYKHASEIIQIGAILLDEHFEKIGTVNQYVHPEHGVLNHFITNLTGITNKQIKNAPRFFLNMMESADREGRREAGFFNDDDDDYDDDDY